MAQAPTLDWVSVPSHIAEGPSEVRHRDGWLVCEVPADSYARLIAAAPELLEAFKRIAASDGMRPGHVEYLSRAEIAAIARDALAKAGA